MFIETYILRILSAFSEYDTLTRVGEELGSTQPSISRAMQKLESELDVALFDRTKNRVVLNETGIFAAGYAKRIMAMQDEMIEKTREKAGFHKSFAVGSVAIMPALTLIEQAKKFYDGIEARYEICDDEKKLIAGLKNDSFQMIVLLHPFKDAACTSKAYFSEHLSVMLPKNHRLAKRKSLALKDLANETFVMYDDIGFWDKVKRDKIPGAHFIRIERKGKNDSLTQLISATDTPSFISDRTTQFSLPENRIAVPLTDPEMNVTFWRVYKKDKAAVYSRFLADFVAATGLAHEKMYTQKEGV